MKLYWLPQLLWALITWNRERLFGHKKPNPPMKSGTTRDVVNPPCWPDGKTNPQPLKW